MLCMCRQASMKQMALCLSLESFSPMQAVRALSVLGVVEHFDTCLQPRSSSACELTPQFGRATSLACGAVLCCSWCCFMLTVLLLPPRCLGSGHWLERHRMLHYCNSLLARVPHLTKHGGQSAAFDSHKYGRTDPPHVEGQLVCPPAPRSV